jgi:hypothetical protein
VLTRLGINWPNRALLPDDLPRMAACGFADAVVFLTDLGQLQGDVDAVLALRKAQPGARVHLRIERRGTLDAAADFAALAKVAWTFGTLADSLSIRNEPTIESPDVTLAAWVAYLTELGELVKEPALPVRIFAPPLSPGSPDFAAWLGATAIAARHFAGLWVHAYGDLDQVGAVLRAARASWAGRLVCTEYNPGAGQAFSLGDWTAAIPRVLALSYELGVESVCLFTWEWDHPDMVLPTSVNVRGSAVESFLKVWRPAMPTPTLYFSPNHAGVRAQTRGIVLHATLSGTAPTLQREYDATLSWFANSASQVSAHAVVGPGGQVAYPVDPAQIAWHAKSPANEERLGLEMVKVHLADPILPEILDGAAKIVAGWCKVYAIPLVWSIERGLAEHHEMPGNDHQDVGGPFDRADFLARVRAHGSQEAELTADQRAKLLDHLNILWGETNAATIAANPAESERACHERIVAIKVLLGVNG